MVNLSEAHEIVDRQTEAALKRLSKEGRFKSPCAAGCFHCCREPVIVERSEVAFMLSQITSQQTASLEARTKQWLDAFSLAGLFQVKAQTDSSDFTALLKFRAAAIYCPVLEEGLCGLYSKRPVACRTHVALRGSSRCSNDELRPSQKFMSAMAVASGSIDVLAAIGGASPNYLFEYDLLPIWIAHQLLGERRRSGYAHDFMVTQTDP